MVNQRPFDYSVGRPSESVGAASMLVQHAEEGHQYTVFKGYTYLPHPHTVYEFIHTQNSPVLSIKLFMFIL